MKKLSIIIFTLIATMTYAAEFAYYDNQFLFSLQKDETPLTQEQYESLNTPYPALNAFISKNQVSKIEPWLPNARPNDHDGDVYLNRIYRLILKQDSNAPLALLSELTATTTAIAGAEREPIMRKYQIPNDPYIGNQWYLTKIQAREAWKLWDLNAGEIPGDRNIVIAVVDDGVEYTHPDLWKNIWINQDEIPAVYFALVDTSQDGFITAEEAINFCGDINGSGKADLRDVISSNSLLTDGLDNDNDGYIDNIIGWDTNLHGYFNDDSYLDDDKDPMATNNSHGTHVAGLAGASTNNGIGVASVGYNISVMPVKAAGDEASDVISTGWAGILYAAHAGADIINCSWGGPGYSYYPQTIINTCYNQYDAIIIAAAGNGDEYGNPTDEPHYPSGYKNVISVTAVSSSDVFSWANYGAADLANFDGVDIAAPGENMFSTILTKLNSYTSLRGTSMASPLVASCMALLKSVYPDSSNNWLVARLLNHTDPIDDINPDYAGQLGTGRVNILKSLVFDKWPKLSYVKHLETIYDDDADSVLNPGESITMLVELENYIGWKTALNVQGILRTHHEGITISDSIGTWNSISSDTTAYNDDDGFTITFSENLPLDDYEFTLELHSNEAGGFPYTTTINMHISLFLDQQKFPFYASNAVEASPIFTDINNDGFQEIIFGDKSGELYIVDYQGIVLNGFPLSLGGQIGGIAIADIDRDSTLEIVTTLFDKQVRVYDTNGQFEWSRHIDGIITAIPAIGNIDSDEELEVIFGATDQKIYAINHDSSDVNGFPVYVGQSIRSGVSLADVNADGKDEIIFGDWGRQCNIMDANGNMISGWPQLTSGTISSEPYVIVTGDSSAIILIGNDQGDMYGFNLDGSQRFVIDGYGAIKSSPAIFTQGDDIFAVFGTTSGNIYNVDVINGILVDNWPKEVSPIYQSLVCADVVNDSEQIQHILAMGNDGLIYAFTQSGDPVNGFPINTRFLSKSSLAITDIDNDNDNEIICGNYSGISVIDLKDERGTVNWAMHRGDISRRGSTHMIITETEEIDLPVNFDFELIGNSPNPFNPATIIKYIISDHAPVHLRIFSLNGKQIIEQEIQSSKIGMNEIRIDMTGFASGIYFYSLEHNATIKKTKMIYLK